MKKRMFNFRIQEQIYNYLKLKSEEKNTTMTQYIIDLITQDKKKIKDDVNISDIDYTIYHFKMKNCVVFLDIDFTKNNNVYFKDGSKMTYQMFHKLFERP